MVGWSKLWMMGALMAGLAGWAEETPSGAEPQAAPRRDAVVAAVEKAMPSVVNIATEEVVPTQDPLDSLFRDFFDPYYRRRSPDTQYSLGSGVIIDEEGYIVTNYHVVARARRVWVRLADGRELEAEKVAETASTDVALLRIRGGLEDRFPAIRLAKDDDLLLGETVLALGNPFGLGGSVSRGILSSKSRRPPLEGRPLDLMDWLQTDAATNPGNSGGPLVNLSGELIGLSVAIYREGQGIGFAIPVKRVGEALGMIYSPENMERLWFGVRLRPGTQPLQVVQVEEGSPAARAGMEPGDLVLGLNGDAPRGFFDFHRRLMREGHGRPVRLELERDGKRRQVSVRMVEEAEVFNADMVRRRLGISVQDLTRELARALGLGRVQGVLIAGAEAETPAAEMGLDQGMVITKVDEATVREVVEVAKRLRGKKSGDKVGLNVLVPRPRGPFYVLEEVRVELTIR